MENTTSPLEGATTQYQVVWTWEPVTWVWLNILQLILAIYGILGNLLVMLVLLRPRHRRCATDTLIGALAVADFLTSIFIIPHPFAITIPDTPGGQVYCRVIQSSFLWRISFCASIFTLTTISIERLAAVRYSSLHQSVFTHTRLPIVIVAIWTFSFILNTFILYLYDIKYGRFCVSFPSSRFQAFLGSSLFIVEYVVPIVSMIAAYELTLYSLRQGQSVTSEGQDSQTAKRFKDAQRRVLHMLYIVVIIFSVCWTPYQFSYLLFSLGVHDFYYHDNYYMFYFEPLYRYTVVLTLANSCVKPVIYAVMSPGFRNAFLQMFRGKSLHYGTRSVFAGLIDDSNHGNTSIIEMRSTDQI